MAPVHKGSPAFSSGICFTIKVYYSLSWTENSHAGRDHLPMARVWRLAVEAGRGWQREQGQGMPGKCLYVDAKCSGSFSRLGRADVWKGR